MGLLEPVDRPFAEVEEVGVVIHNTDIGRHVGFLYRRPDGSTGMLHLAFHCILKDDEVCEYAEWVKNHYASQLRWAELGLPEDSKTVFAAILSQILLGDPQIPFGFDSSGCVFSDDFEFIPGPVGKGLTCATFITSTLTGYGHTVVMDDWPVRPEDKAWQDQILVPLKRFASQEHIDAIIADTKRAPRYRPEEVVAAANQPISEWPISFVDAVSLAEQILSELA